MRMNVESDSDSQRDRKEGFLWCGMLVPPVIWLVQFELNYLLVPWVCSTGHTMVLHVTSALFLLAASALGFAVWRKRDDLAIATADEDGKAVSRRFMALVGIWSSALFSLAIA